MGKEVKKYQVRCLRAFVTRAVYGCMRYKRAQAFS
jgi:hypothetical protein